MVFVKQSHIPKGTVFFFIMVTIDSPNIFWTRIKEKCPDVIYQTIYHENPYRATTQNHKFRIKYPPHMENETYYFIDKASKYSMEGWWLHND